MQLKLKLKIISVVAEPTISQGSDTCKQQFRVFPFGLALTPRVFKMCVHVALEPLQGCV